MTYLSEVQLYEKHKDGVLKLSLAVQNYDGEKYVPVPMTDAEIAKRLALEERDVTEIRCIAEADSTSIDVLKEAERFIKERSKRAKNWISHFRPKT